MQRISKKKHDTIVERLIVDIEWLAKDVAHHANMSEYHREAAEYWRKQYELLSMTPEIKADTESAFKRGETTARTKMLAYLHGEFDRLGRGMADALESE